MNKSSSTLLSKVASVGFFVLVSTPSVKVLYSNPIINLIPLLLFVLVFLVASARPITIGRLGKPVLLALFGFFLLFYLYYLFGPYSYHDNESFFRYVFFFSVLFLVILLNKWLDPNIILSLLILWAACIACLRLTGNLHLDLGKGQTYLTVGLPMGAGLTAGILTLIQKRNKNVWQLAFYIGVILIIISSLLLSRGRSNLLFPLIVLTIFFLMSMTYNKKIRLKYLWLSVVVIVLIYIAYISFSTNEEYKALNRIGSTVEATDEEARYVMWKNVLRLILENPLGYGVDSYHYLLRNYPHNIFMEVLLSIGVFGLIFLLFLLGLFFKVLRQEIKRAENGQTIILGCTALYFFFSWNTSFDFATAYVPLGMILLSCLKSTYNRELTEETCR